MMRSDQYTHILFMARMKLAFFGSNILVLEIFENFLIRDF